MAWRYFVFVQSVFVFVGQTLTMDPTLPVTLHMRPLGYTHCESIPVPAMPRRRASQSQGQGQGQGQGGGYATGSYSSAAGGQEALWTAHRDVFAVGATAANTRGRHPVLHPPRGGGRDARDAASSRLAAAAPVSVRVEVAADEHGTRRVWVSCPVRVVNAARDRLVLQTLEQPPPPDASSADSSEFDASADVAAFGLHRSGGIALHGLYGSASTPAAAAAAPGEGDCWLPPAASPAPPPWAVDEMSGWRRPPPARGGSGMAAEVGLDKLNRVYP